VVGAALINSLKVAKKDIKNAKIIINGAGAAGISIAKHIMALGAENLTLVDRFGAIYDGKPENNADAARMLRLLSGSTHRVITGVVITRGENIKKFAEVTRVTFREMTDGEIEDYISSSEPYDKAGGYAVQGLASLYVSGIEGDYFNVVGLPVNLLYKALKQEFGIDINSLKA
jgi:septum formation protein